MLRSLATRRTVTAAFHRAGSRRMLGAGYTGPREKGYDAAEMDKFRALPDQPFFMLNLLKIADLGKWQEYSAATAEVFKQSGGEAVYVGQIGDRFNMPVLVKGDSVDTSGYSVMLLVKYPSLSGFFRFIDSPEYQAAYPLRLEALEEGKSTLIPSFPIAGSATAGLKTKIPGQD